MTAGNGPPATGVATVPELLARRARLESQRRAVRTVGGESITFADWDTRASAVASGLLDRGLRPGDAVVLRFAGAEWTQYAVAFCGVLRAGGVAVPCSDRLPPARLAYVVRDSRAVLVLSGTAQPPPDPAGVPVAALSDVERAGVGPVPVRPGPHDRAQILYTSGTTGLPKGVCATHANLAYGAAAHPRRRRLAHSEQFLHAFPVGTNAGQAMLLNAVDAHPGALTLPRFTPNRFARLIEQERVGSVFVVPAMAAELVRSPAITGRDLSPVRLVGSTAAPLPPAVALAVTRAFPAAKLVNYYTSTEAAPAQTMMIFDPRRPDAIGRVADGGLRITDRTGRPVPPGTIGEVWLRSPFPRRYLDTGSPAGAEPLPAEPSGTGWVPMGDLGRIDEAGYLYLVDRPQDVIKSGAFKISTPQVEAAVHEHDGVGDAAAVALPHPVLGSIVGLAVVPRPGADRDRLELAALRAFLRDRLADYELPAQVILLERLPRNDAGKVRKTDLPALFAAATGKEQA